MRNIFCRRGAVIGSRRRIVNVRGRNIDRDGGIGRGAAIADLEFKAVLARGAAVRRIGKCPIAVEHQYTLGRIGYLSEGQRIAIRIGYEGAQITREHVADRYRVRMVAGNRRRIGASRVHCNCDDPLVSATITITDLIFKAIRACKATVRNIAEAAIAIQGQRPICHIGEQRCRQCVPSHINIIA